MRNGQSHANLTLITGRIWFARTRPGVDMTVSRHHHRLYAAVRQDLVRIAATLRGCVRGKFVGGLTRTSPIAQNRKRFMLGLESDVVRAKCVLKSSATNTAK